MNCRRIKKLIPLHIEGDLQPGIATRVASHLESCGGCNSLAVEYRGSQDWLRSPDAPKFDAKFLLDFKRDVLNAVEEQRVKPSILAVIGQHWNRRQLLALSAAGVIIAGMVFLYFYQGRGHINTHVIAIKEEPSPIEEVKNDGVPATGTKAAPGASLAATRHPVFHPRRASGISGRELSAARKEMAPEVEAQAVRMALPEPRISYELPFIEPSKDSREVLRIEIQTGDPSIRIIWFAPRQTDSQQSKPASD